MDIYQYRLFFLWINVLCMNNVQNPCWLMILGDSTNQSTGDVVYDPTGKSLFYPTRIQWKYTEASMAMGVPQHANMVGLYGKIPSING